MLCYFKYVQYYYLAPSVPVEELQAPAYPYKEALDKLAENLINKRNNLIDSRSNIKWISNVTLNELSYNFATKK